MSIQRVQAKQHAGSFLLVVAALAAALLALAWSGVARADISHASMAVTSSPASGSVAAGSTVTYTGTVSAVDTNFTAGNTITLNLPSGVTPSGPATCTFSGTGLTLAVSGTTCTITGTASGTGTITLTVPTIVTASGGATIAGATMTGTAGSTTQTSAPSGQLTATGSIELRSIADDGHVIADQDVINNVRGTRHVVCAINETDGAGVLLPPGSIDIDDVVVQSGGGATSVNDPDPTFTDPVFFTGNGQNGGVSGATCLSWVSTEAGDQEISWVVPGIGPGGNPLTINWDTDNDGNDTNPNTTGPSNRAIIKEWNVLTDSEIFINGASQGTNQNPVITRNVVLDPIYGTYSFSGGSIRIQDIFHGTHVTRTGAVVNTRDLTGGPGIDGGVNGLVGVNWTVTVNGCADLTDNLISQQSSLTGTTGLDQSGSVSVANNFPDISVDPGDCLPGQSIVVTFTGTEPGPLGSGPGRTVTETVTINLVQQIAAKKVFLAWAGQRVVLEQDWRNPPGDESDLDPAGTCPLTGPERGRRVSISYIKSSGPGNFLPSLTAQINGSDQATVPVLPDTSQHDTAPNYPQDSCISRVIFESEDPGQVDVEALVDDEIPFIEIPDASKVAFVIYYMKFNSVTLSLATQVSKPTHNGSAAADYAPGNPWDATKDDPDGVADWNVSRDILVRGRVTGWFVNANPSGRPADTSNPLNVLPANRWVMPMDWPLLAGGPADPADGSDAIGTAEQFRPYYNLLFAPNNTQGIVLTSPEGATPTQVATVVSFTASTGALVTSNPAAFSPGQSIIVGTISDVTVTAIGPTGTLTVTGLSAAAAGTGIFVASGVPFEGPLSLIDIPGLAATNGGIAGAALSNIPGLTNSATRDTILADGDIDWWDAPMPNAMISVQIRGAGFIKQVLKEDVYYLGTPNSAAQVFTNPYYISNIPESPYLPAGVAGGGYLWNSWGPDGPAAAGGDASSVGNGAAGQGPYRFWQPVLIDTNSAGFGDPLVNAGSAGAANLAAIRAAYSDPTIARDLVVYSDNRGEFMVTANGDFNLTYDQCATNTLGGGRLCAPGNLVGKSTITATADYPDFRGKHFPVASNSVTVNWTWGGFKDVRILPGEDPQISYVVFSALDRDGFCSVPSGSVSLHPVLTSADAASPVGGNAALGNEVEMVDFLIDSDQGGIILTTSGGTSPISVTKEFASGVPTFSTAANTTIREFPNSPLNPGGAAGDECQAWVRISNSLLAVTNVLVVAHNDPPEGDVTFDRIIDFSTTATLTLNFRWSLVTWTGADNIPVTDALGGTGANDAGNDISDQVTAVYGWDAPAQDWLGYFPAGVGIPGANDLTALKMGQAYWFAIKGPASVNWTIATNVDR